MGKLLLAFSATFAIAGVLFNSISWIIVSLALISLFLYGRLKLISEINEMDIEVDREILEELIFAGEKATVKIQILNKGNSVLRAEIEDSLPEGFEIVGGEKIIATEIVPSSIFKFMYSIVAERRGEYTIKGMKIKLSDVLGLNEEDKEIDCITKLKIHTRKESLEKAKKIAGREHLRFSGFTKNPAVILREFEFDGIREYVAGDKARDIYWKVLPKFDELLTKIYRKEGTLSSLVMLDCSRSMRISGNGVSMIDHGIDIALQISRVLLSSMQPTGVLLFDENSIIDEAFPEVGRHQFQQIISILQKTPSSIESNEEISEKIVRKESEINIPSTQQDDEGFFAALGNLTNRQKFSSKGIGLENEVKRQISKHAGSKLLFIIISDMISSRDSVLSAARLCQRTNNVMILIHTYPDWYSGSPDEIRKDEAEKLYQNFIGNISVEAKMRRVGVHYLRVGPADSTSRIVKTIRRST